MDYREILLRLLASVLIGSLIGLDRNMHGKPTGVRTLGLVCLGASLLTMAGMNILSAHGQSDPSSLSRVIQGLITGIGFLGSGVIVHENGSDRIRGLTTAASIWITAILGILCGMGSWQIAGIALVIVFILFVFGKPLEQALHRRWMNKPEKEKQAITAHEE
ncbi:MAG TPA: MgtC/SapB family protein [Telluria sp.]